MVIETFGQAGPGPGASSRSGRVVAAMQLHGHVHMVHMAACDDPGDREGAQHSAAQAATAQHSLPQVHRFTVRQCTVQRCSEPSAAPFSAGWRRTTERQCRPVWFRAVVARCNGHGAAVELVTRTSVLPAHSDKSRSSCPAHRHSVFRDPRFFARADSRCLPPLPMEEDEAAIAWCDQNWLRINPLTLDTCIDYLLLYTFHQPKYKLLHQQLRAEAPHDVYARVRSGASPRCVRAILLDSV